MCKGATQSGSINGIPWSNNCQPYPATTILRDHNPSCSVDTYQGGMICCHHVRLTFANTVLLCHVTKGLTIADTTDGSMCQCIDEWTKVLMYR